MPSLFGFGVSPYLAKHCGEDSGNPLESAFQRAMAMRDAWNLENKIWPTNSPMRVLTKMLSGVPRHGRSKRGRLRKHANERKRAPMSAKERKRKRTIRAGFWQNGFFADFYFWAAGFFSRIFSPEFFSSFLWEKVPRKILQENPRENPPNFIQQKSSDTCLQIGRGKRTQKSAKRRKREERLCVKIANNQV